LVNDFGQTLGVGAYMSALRRTKIGDFDIKDAITWEDLRDEVEVLLGNEANVSSDTNDSFQKVE
jgi:tRNA pseudouridine55 synthase